MAFDSVAFAPTVQDRPADLDLAAAPCPEWTAANPDRALALLFVAPVDCAAVVILVSLPAKA